MKTEFIGLTGGIGSGKSMVAYMLQLLGYPVYISDKEASRLINTQPDIRRDIIRHFGDSAYKGKQLDKPVMAGIIFQDPQALITLNSIVHPRVMEDFRQWGEQQQSKLVFFESAILFEARLNHHFKHIICVTAPLEVRLQRVISRDNTSTEQIRQRIRNQMDENEKCRQSDFIIFNDNDHIVIEQILKILEKLSPGE